VNIATFSLGRMAEGGEAVCLIAVDAVVDEQTREKIRKIEHVKIVDFVSL